MAKFSMKKGGKEVGQADVYAKPHTMSGTNLDASESVTKKGNGVDAIKMSIGSQVFKSQMDEIKSEGIKQRGAGAATKGFTSRGPMA
jgi:glycerol-3-phosphate dehydrogenase